MGSVKIDLYGKGLFYKSLNLSDVNVIRLLIEFRYKYDTYLYSETDNHYNVAGEVQGINEEMLLMYVALDETIKQCKFDEEQLKIIKMYEHGYIYKEIANELGLDDTENIRKRLNTICKEIAKQNLWNWRKVAYVEALELKTKCCSKCKEKLPATDEFFRADSRNSTGLQSQCRTCEK